MISDKKKLLWRDSFLCTLLTLVVSGILLLIFVNLNVLDPFYKAFKDFSFTDIYYSRLYENHKKDKDIIIINVKQSDRFLIAQAIEKVQQQHPIVVGIDAIFKDRKMAFTDSILRSVLHKYDNIVTSYYYSNDSIVTNHDFFKKAKPIEGFINVNFFNDDKVIRDFVGYKTQENKLSFATQIALKSGGLTERDSKKLNEGIPINYFGNLDAFLTFDIDELIELESIPSMENKIILFGYLGTPTGNPFDIEDKHFTPLNKTFAGRSTPDMYGVLIHANIIKMLTNGSFISKVPKVVVYIFALVCCFFTIMFGMRFYKKSTLAYDILIKLIQLVISVTLLYLALLLLKVNVYLFVTPILVLTVFGLEMIDFYVYLLDFLKKRFKWQSYLLD
ncbi:CHASE2 domain-containing protein [Seonamhaeicola sp. MEBiC1930]|uniref:CHASE2 domain-containing protein n=1 Tax=Seonamhaeicola sp. MEBiC01930 TaxID=2976768 RepID=UPI003245E821